MDDDFSNVDIGNMTFGSIEEAYDFYNSYARARGFSIRKDTVQKDAVSNVIKNRLFVCSCQGLRRQELLEMPGRQREHCLLTRCECGAKLRIKLDRETMRYTVTLFVDEHNHELVPKYGVPQLRSHRHVGEGHSNAAHAMRHAGINPSKTMDFFNYCANGYENVGFTRPDLWNKMYRDLHKKKKDGDTNIALAYLYGKSEGDPMFFFEYTVDEKNRLDKLFWADGRSRDEYAPFRDILIFDATYMTNSYKFPLVILVGANNHRNTCIFGAALIQNESTESYLWVLNTFLSAMNNKIPLSVVTDGDKSMQATIATVFPNAKHRLCRWHLGRNATSNVHVDDFGKTFKKMMALKCSIEEFEFEWRKMVVRHGIENHKWIVDVHAKRHMWSEGYLRGQFFALVKSTQRCEGMNAFLNKFLQNNRKLIDFVRDYHRGLERLRINNVGQEVVTNYTKPVPTTSWKEIEDHAANVYTRAIFKKIRKEIQSQSMLWHEHIISHVDGDARTYVVADYNNKGLLRNVLFRGDGLLVSCDCLRFESCGMICKHILYVLKCECLDYIPQSCINPRWTAVISEHFRDKNLSSGTTTEIEMARYGYILSRCNEMGYYAKMTLDRYTEIVDGIAKLTTRAKDLWLLKVNTIGNQAESSQPVEFGVLDPNIAKPKGKPKEINSKKQRKPRHCKKCKSIGHTTNRCPKQRVDASEDTNSTYHGFDDNPSQSSMPELRHSSNNLFGYGYNNLSLLQYFNTYGDNASSSLSSHMPIFRPN